MPSNNTFSVFFYTYILQSRKDNDHYIGYTENLRQRYEEHRRGQSFATKFRLPFKLIYYEACLDKFDAIQREKYLKSTAGRRFIAKRLKGFRVNHMASNKK